MRRWKPGPLGTIALLLLLGSSPAIAQEPTFTSPLGMEFVRIPAGEMLVGRFQPACPSPPATGTELRRQRELDPRARWTAEDYRLCEELVRRHSTPGFRVRIDRPFYLGRYEVTQAEWERVMGSNPSAFQAGRVGADAARHPVESVTWEDAQAFIARLNELDPTSRYRLPTEFEWEYAARAGAEQDLPWNVVRDHAWIADVDKGTTHPVGLKKPNAWGVHDMLGNVWEWVQDFYNERTFADPVPPTAGETHVLRGGGFLADVKNASFFVRGAGPGNGFDVGFRVVREPR